MGAALSDIPSSKSHLYEGFQFAGELSSVREQRKLQAALVARLQPGKLLVVGCAYGEELASLLGALDLENSRVSLTAIDLVDTEASLRRFQYAQTLDRRLEFKRLDLFRSEELADYGRFDLVQCGFVLHDIPYSLKDRAIGVLAQAVRPGGYVVLSDMFATGSTDARVELTHVYNDFLREGELAVCSGDLGLEQWQLLAGDGITPGLIRARAEAKDGARDHIDRFEKCTARVVRCGLIVLDTVINSVNPRLAVILGRRPSANTTTMR